eukprot:TRINITY_DN42954_c0_g1_i1.p1 TRINITY_DN42954_c0_g1~~TRINITY_DN42954_c0_g1_i1.p1  ORF type:complete len:870 (+),score=156.54 TRINITY_DN42954_c0_g1_i1:62-2671(+)
MHTSAAGGLGPETCTFLGSAVARYDVDELEVLGKYQKRESYVEVRRPDGTVAKSRGERTFYGAFTGGFSAGHWGTVGSKEGWTPSAFVSSRSKRDSQAPPQVEDIMDDEDLQEHRSSRRTIAARGDFAARRDTATCEATVVGATTQRCRRTVAADAACPIGEMTREMREELFGPSQDSLGRKLLKAGAQHSTAVSVADASETDAKGLATAVTVAENSSPLATSPLQVEAAVVNVSTSSHSEPTPPRGKRKYGCSPMPAGYKAPLVENHSDDPPAVQFNDVSKETGGSSDFGAFGDFVPVAIGRKLLRASQRGGSGRKNEDQNSSSACARIGEVDRGPSRSPSKKSTPAVAVVTQRRLEADLERLWRVKTDMNGVGYGLRQTISSSLVSSRIQNNNRLYMCSKRGNSLNKATGYSGFGTGVFDMDDADMWEDIYDSKSSKECLYDSTLALKDEDVEEEMRAARLDDVRSTVGLDGVPGFVEAVGRDESCPDFSAWFPRPVPRGYRGVRASCGPPSAEARTSSAEHRALLDFLDKHGGRRLLDPQHRAELIGERGRGFAKRNPPPPAASDVVGGSDGTGTNSSKGSSGNAIAGGDNPAKGPPSSLEDSTKPLWKNVSNAQKQTLLESLGRNFISAENQDMDGRAARHEPFKSDASKQRRYAQFCLALEGRASASEALKDTGGLNDADRMSELAEFGRVYRCFRQERPEVDMCAALDVGSEIATVPVLRRTVKVWIPAKLLCKRWGVPEPRLAQTSSSTELPGAKRQREYMERVQTGIARATGRSNNFSDAPSADVVAASAAPISSVGGRGGASGVGCDTAGDTAGHAQVASSSTSVLAPLLGSPLGDVGGEEIRRAPPSLFAAIFGDTDDE